MKIIKKIISLLHLPISEETLDSLWQFIKFGLVGVSNTLISYVCYVGCIFVGLHYFVANLIGFVISVLNSFYWNNKFVFKCKSDERRALLPTLLKTFVSYGSTGLVLNSILLWIGVDMLNISEYIMPIINLVITIPLNFLMNKLWAYKVEEYGEEVQDE